RRAGPRPLGRPRQRPGRGLALHLPDPVPDPRLGADPTTGHPGGARRWMPAVVGGRPPGASAAGPGADGAPHRRGAHRHHLRGRRTRRPVNLRLPPPSKVNPVSLSRLSRRSLLAGLLVLPLGLSACSGDEEYVPDPESLQIYSSQHKEITEAWAEAFTEETGVETQVRRGQDSSMGHMI